MKYEFRRHYAISDNVIISQGLYSKELSSVVGFDGFGKWEFDINPHRAFKNIYVKIVMTLDKHTGKASILWRKREVNNLHRDQGNLSIINQQIWEF